MKIGMDIDGVLADFVSPFLHILEQRVGGGPIDPASITDPNFQSHPFLTQDVIYNCMVETSYDPNFWRVLAPLPSESQWRSLSRLCREHEVAFVTHRWVRDTYDIHRVTRDWLSRQGIDDPVVHFTQEKKSQIVNHLAIELFVDDRHENCHDVATQTDAVVMMPHRPYNCTFDHPKVLRIKDLNEMFAYLANK